MRKYVRVESIDDVEIDVEIGTCRVDGKLVDGIILEDRGQIMKLQLIWWKAHGALVPHKLLRRISGTGGDSIANIMRKPLWLTERRRDCDPERNREYSRKYYQSRAVYRKIEQDKKRDAEISLWAYKSTEELKKIKRTVRNRKNGKELVDIINAILQKRQ